MKNDITSIADLYASKVLISEKKETKHVDFGFAEKQKEKKMKDGAEAALSDKKKKTEKKKTMKESTANYLGAFDRLYAKALNKKPMNEDVNFPGPDVSGEDGLEADVSDELGVDHEDGHEDGHEEEKFTIELSKEDGKALCKLLKALEGFLNVEDEAEDETGGEIEDVVGDVDDQLDNEYEEEAVDHMRKEAVDMKAAPGIEGLQKKGNIVVQGKIKAQGGKAEDDVIEGEDGDGKPVKKAVDMGKKPTIPQKTDNLFGKGKK